MSGQAQYFLLIVLSLVFPPFAVIVARGCGCDLFINIFLTLCGILPGTFILISISNKPIFYSFCYLGTVHAIYIIWKEKNKLPTQNATPRINEA